MKRFRELLEESLETTSYLMDELDRASDKYDTVREDLKELIKEVNELIQDKSDMNLNDLFMKLVRIYEELL